MNWYHLQKNYFQLTRDGWLVIKTDNKIIIKLHSKTFKSVCGINWEHVEKIFFSSLMQQLIPDLKGISRLYA